MSRLVVKFKGRSRVRLEAHVDSKGVRTTLTIGKQIVLREARVASGYIFPSCVWLHFFKGRSTKGFLMYVWAPPQRIFSWSLAAVHSYFMDR